MQRTNIYLEADQAQALEVAARAQGISRAALIRRMIGRGLEQSDDGNLETDLAAIEATFGVARDEDFLERGTDERARHLERLRAGR